MSEVRCDPITGQWVGVHTEDSWGPEQYSKEEHQFLQEATCQFCPGKEHLTPSEVDAVRENGSLANSPDWQIRVVPNKFPALRIEGNLDLQKNGIFEMSQGIGAHEVLIETPDHHRNLADFSEDELVLVIQKYQSRLQDLSKDKRFKYVVIFKNYGESAGASVEHAHTQIIALPMIPQSIIAELRGTQDYYRKHKRCIFCDMMQQEYKDKVRIIAENEDFLSFCPFVPRYPFECWIMPKEHQSAFVSISENQQKTFARMLKEVLLRLKGCLSDPSYNFYLHLSPINYKGKRSFHWHMEIIPKLTHVSGFEWGTGFYVVRTEPSIAAQYLKNV